MFASWRVRLDGAGRLAFEPKAPGHPGYLFGTWEEGLPVWELSPTGARRRIDPDLTAAMPDPLAEGIFHEAPAAVRTWQSAIPMRAWSSRLHFGRWLAFSWLGRRLEARDLLAANPALYSLVVHRGLQRAKGRDLFLALFRLRRREILAKLGLPGEEAVVRLLARLDGRGATHADFTALRRCLSSPSLRAALAKLDSFPIRLCDLFSRHPLFFDSVFFRHELAAQRKKGARRLAESDVDAFIARIPSMILRWRDILELQKKTGPRSLRPGTPAARTNEIPGLRLASILTWDRLEEYGKSLAARPDLSIPPPLPERPRDNPVRIPFPEPSVPPCRGITPVVDSLELLSEGEEMRHCVGTYVARILRRQCDIYRVQHAGERATLEIRLVRGRPRPGELRSFRNRPVSPALRAFVSQWYMEETGAPFVGAFEAAPTAPARAKARKPAAT